MSFQVLSNEPESSISNSQPRAEGVSNADINPSSNSTVSSSNPAPAAGSPSVRVLLRTLTGQLMPVVFPSFANVTVLQLKQKVEEGYAIPVSFQRTVYAGREMVDSDLLTSYNVENESVIHLVLRQNQPQAQVEGAVAASMAVNPRAEGAAMIAIPVAAANLNRIGDLDIPNLHQITRSARVIKIYSLIDVLFVIIWSLAYWPLALAIIFCACGYHGANHVKPNYIIAYAIFIVGSIGFRIWFIIVIQSLFYSILFAIGILIELYILTVVVKFAKQIQNVSEEDRAAIRQLVNPRIVLG